MSSFRRVLSWFRGHCRHPRGDAGEPPSPAALPWDGGEPLSPDCSWGHNAPFTLPMVRSLPSQPTTVTFKNSTPVCIECVWIDYGGNEVAEGYPILEPGEEYDQGTYVLHPWIFRESDTGATLVVDRRVVAFPEDKPMSEMIISRPVDLEWSPREHARFPEEFQQWVKDLLLCNNRMNRRSLEIGTSSEEDLNTALHPFPVLPSELMLLIIAKAAPRTLDIIK